MAASCIFCDNRAGSREHLWPQWIFARRDFGAFRLQRANGPEVVLNDTGLTVKTVCAACNTGWMSKLEEEIKPVLAPMFDDTSITLNKVQQRLLAVWITKMAFLFDSTKGRNAENKFYSRTEGTALRVSQQIPALTRIWMSRLDQAHRGITGTDFTLLSGAKRVGEGAVVTLTNEHFIAQIVTLHSKGSPTNPAVIEVTPKPGDWENMLIP